MTTGSQLEKVEAVHVAHINTGQVASIASHIRVVVAVDEERSSAHGESRVTVLALS